MRELLVIAAASEPLFATGATVTFVPSGSAPAGMLTWAFAVELLASNEVGLVEDPTTAVTDPGVLVGGATGGWVVVGAVVAGGDVGAAGEGDAGEGEGQFP